MNGMLKQFICKFLIVYLDDIFVSSKEREEHLKRVNSILQRLREEKLFVNIIKCSLMK